MNKNKQDKSVIVLVVIMFSILLLVPFLSVLGWYILYYGGSMVLVYIFKLGLALLWLTTLLFWVGVVIGALRK